MQVAFQLYSFQWFITLALIYIINWIDANFPHSRETWSKSNDLYQHLALQMFQNRQHRRKGWLIREYSKRPKTMDLIVFSLTESI